MTEEKIRIVDTIDTGKSVWQFRDDMLVVVRIKDNVHLELEDMIKEQKILVEEKSEYIPLKLMIVPGKHADVSKEARDFSNAKENTSIMRAEAIVVESLAHRIMANFIKNFYKTPMTIKIFSDEEKALQWLSNLE